MLLHMSINTVIQLWIDIQFTLRIVTQSTVIVVRAVPLVDLTIDFNILNRFTYK